jgi:hypothetical protein
MENREYIYKYGQQSSSFDPTSQTEDIGNNSMRLVPTDLKLAICSGIYTEWTSDVTITKI